MNRKLFTIKEHFTLLPFFISIFLLLVAFTAQAQQIDSLKNLLKTLPPNTQRVDALNNLSWILINSDSKKALQYAKNAMQLAKKIQYSPGQIKAYNNYGVHYIVSSVYEKAIDYLLKGLKLADSTQNNYWRGTLNLNIGLIHSQMKNLPESQNYYKEALHYGKISKDTLGIIITYNNIGYNYILEKKYKKAEPYIAQGLALALKAQHEAQQALLYGNFAIIYMWKEKNAQAKEAFLKSIELSKKVDDKYSLTNTYIDITRFYFKLNKLEIAHRYLKKGLKLCKIIGNKQYEVTFYELYSQYYKKTQDIAKAFAYKEKAIALKDSVFSLKNQKQMDEIKANYELEKANAEKLILQQQITLEKKARQTQRIISIISLIGFLGIIIVAILLYHSSQKSLKVNQQLVAQKQEVEKQRDIISEKTTELQGVNHHLKAANEELKQTQDKIAVQRDALEVKNQELSKYRTRIGKSIESAKLIQNAVLPATESLEHYFADHFVLYKPKDVVSGDFYWIDQLGNTTFAIVADCTGHGVPGAFMTLIGHILLDRVIRVNKISDPAQILSQLHEEVKQVLRQNQTGDIHGMDLAIIAVEKKPHAFYIEFSGAKNGLLFFNADTQNFEEVRGTRKAIGGVQPSDKVFQKHCIELPEGSILYIGTDGLADQNNYNRAKFSKQRLNKLIAQNAHLPLAQQKGAIEIALQQHMDNIEQRDDILWMGIKL